MLKLGGDAPQAIVRETFVSGTPGALCAQLSASEANLARPTMPDADFAAFRSHAATPDDQKPGAPAAAPAPAAETWSRPKYLASDTANTEEEESFEVGMRQNAMEFRAHDVDDSETLDFHEFCAFIREREEGEHGPAELMARFDELDVNHNGRIEMHEYLMFSLRDALSRSVTRVLDLLIAWDADGSGDISKREFRKAIKALGFEGVRDKEVDAVFDEMDDSGDGKVDYREMNKKIREFAGLTAKGKYKLRRGKAGGRKGAALSSSVKLDYNSGVPVAHQLRDALKANAVRVIDLFRDWDEDGDGTIDFKEVPRRRRRRQSLHSFEPPPPTLPPHKSSSPHFSRALTPPPPPPPRGAVCQGDAGARRHGRRRDRQGALRPLRSRRLGPHRVWRAQHAAAAEGAGAPRGAQAVGRQAGGREAAHDRRRRGDGALYAHDVDALAALVALAAAARPARRRDAHGARRGAPAVDDADEGERLDARPHRRDHAARLHEPRAEEGAAAADAHQIEEHGRPADVRAAQRPAVAAASHSAMRRRRARQGGGPRVAVEQRLTQN